MVVDDYCMGCAFHSPGVKCCNYLLVMGIRRGCPGGAGCDKKMTKGELNAMGAPKDWNKELGKQMWVEGKGDAEIAKATGVTQGTISYFRRKHWEPESVAMLAEEESSGRPFPTEDEGRGLEVSGDREAAPELDPVIPETRQESVPCDDGENACDDDSLVFAALEEATENLRGMDAVMTAQIITALWNWSDPAKLQEAKAFLDYLIGRHEHE